MTTYTENYNLGKQTDHDDKFDMDVITQNMDIIDSCLKNLDDRIKEISGSGMPKKACISADSLVGEIVHAEKTEDEEEEND